jgi:hypothetical protein
MINYYSPLLLPSNGLEYDPIIYLKELTVGSVFIHYDEFYMNMEIGKIISILNNHFKHKDIKNVADMYYGDVIYIWNYLCSKSFNIDSIKKQFVCSNCSNSKIIKIPLKDIEINYLENKKVELEFNVNENFSIFYRRRKMSDNIHFTFFTLEDKKETLDYVYNYSINQILYIKDIKKNKKIEKEEFKNFLSYFGLTKAYDFFKQIRTEDFGFYSDYLITCDNCQQKTEIKLIDPIEISFFHRGLEITNEEYQNFIELIMTINSLKYISFKELLEIPNSKLNLITESIKKLQEQKYSKNKGSYFDQVMEDM